jgi:hypothetical protein
MKIAWMLFLNTVLVCFACKVGTEEDAKAVQRALDALIYVGDAPELIKNESKLLSRAEIQSFLEMVEKQKYWNLPTKDEDPNAMGMDGAQWILEGVRDGNYKIVDRWSPEDGPVRKLCYKMLSDFAKIKLPSQEVY